MKDVNISEFWGLELMMYTNSFNNPERFDERCLSFVEQGPLPENEYHHTSLITYMCNLNIQKAVKHFGTNNPDLVFLN